MKKTHSKTKGLTTTFGRTHSSNRRKRTALNHDRFATSDGAILLAALMGIRRKRGV